MAPKVTVPARTLKFNRELCRQISLTSFSTLCIVLAGMPELSAIPIRRNDRLVCRIIQGVPKDLSGSIALWDVFKSWWPRTR